MKKIIITIIMILIIVILGFFITYFSLQKKYQQNEAYYKTEFYIEFLSENYSVKIPQGMAFEDVSGYTIYRFKTLKSKNKLRKEIEELYNSSYKNLNKYNNDGYKLYYDEMKNITIGYKIDDFGITDLLLIVYEGLY